MQTVHRLQCGGHPTTVFVLCRPTCHDGSLCSVLPGAERQELYREGISAKIVRHLARGHCSDTPIGPRSAIAFGNRSLLLSS